MHAAHCSPFPLSGPVLGWGPLNGLEAARPPFLFSGRTRGLSPSGHFLCWPTLPPPFQHQFFEDGISVQLHSGPQSPRRPLSSRKRLLTVTRLTYQGRDFSGLPPSPMRPRKRHIIVVFTTIIIVVWFYALRDSMLTNLSEHDFYKIYVFKFLLSRFLGGWVCADSYSQENLSNFRQINS